MLRCANAGEHDAHRELRSLALLIAEKGLAKQTYTRRRYGIEYVSFCP